MFALGLIIGIGVIVGLVVGGIFIYKRVLKGK